MVFKSVFYAAIFDLMTLVNNAKQNRTEWAVPVCFYFFYIRYIFVYVNCFLMQIVLSRCEGCQISNALQLNPNEQKTNDTIKHPQRQQRTQGENKRNWELYPHFSKIYFHEIYPKSLSNILKKDISHYLRELEGRGPKYSSG